MHLVAGLHNAHPGTLPCRATPDLEWRPCQSTLCTHSHQRGTSPLKQALCSSDSSCSSLTARKPRNHGTPTAPSDRLTVSVTVTCNSARKWPHHCIVYSRPPRRPNPHPIATSVLFNYLPSFPSLFLPFPFLSLTPAPLAPSPRSSPASSATHHTHTHCKISAPPRGGLPVSVYAPPITISASQPASQPGTASNGPGIGSAKKKSNHQIKSNQIMSNHIKSSACLNRRHASPVRSLPRLPAQRLPSTNHSLPLPSPHPA